MPASVSWIYVLQAALEEKVLFLCVENQTEDLQETTFSDTVCSSSFVLVPHFYLLLVLLHIACIF